MSSDAPAISDFVAACSTSMWVRLAVDFRDPRPASAEFVDTFRARVPSKRDRRSARGFFDFQPPDPDA
jgi:hypothetical protein